MKNYFLAAVVVFAFGCSSSDYVETREWKSIEKSLQTQLITANDGDVIELPEGNYMFTKSLTMAFSFGLFVRNAQAIFPPVLTAMS